MEIFLPFNFPDTRQYLNITCIAFDIGRDENKNENISKKVKDESKRIIDRICDDWQDLAALNGGEVGAMLEV